MRELRGDWRDLFGAFRMALDLRKIALAFVGTVLTWAVVAGVLCLSLLMYQKQDGRSGLLRELKAGEWDRVSLRVKTFSDATFKHSEVALCPCEPGAGPKLPVPSKAGFAILAVCGLAWLWIWSFFGGAITRIAAVEIAKDERIEFGEGTRFAHAHFWSYFWSPISVAAAILVFSLGIVAASWVCSFTWDWFLGKVIFLLGFPLALLGGALILLLLLGGVLGFSLLFPAVSAEGTDAFDAVSRAFSYVFSRPWRWLWYQLVAAAYAVPSCLFVLLFTWAFIRITLCLGMAGMDHKGFLKIVASMHPALGGEFLPLPDAAHWSLKGLALASTGLLYVLLGMAMAYGRSYFWTSQTLVYFLLRRNVDGTEMKEVFEEESEEDLVAGGQGGASAPANKT